MSEHLLSQADASVAADEAIRSVSIKRSVLPVVLGNALEFYDFTIYAYFAATIGRAFFPADRPGASLLLALAGYSVGFVARPLGSVLLGSLADRHGRRPALVVTILMMAFGTALIALCPTYAAIGVAAPTVVLAARILQGFSVGGEAGVSSAWLMERTHHAGRCHSVSWQLCSQGGAILAGALVATMLNLSLSVGSMERWGWRLGFLPGLLIVPLLLFLRRRLPETQVDGPRARSTLAELFGEHRRTLVYGIMLSVSSAVFVQINTHYLPIHLTNTLNYPRELSFLLSCAVGAVLLLTAPAFGRLCDRLQRRKPIQYFTLSISMLCVAPVFAVINSGQNLGLSVLLITLLMTTNMASSSACFVMLMEAFPQHLRATGLSVIYGVSVTLFGGTALLMATWLVKATGDALAPAWYATLACAVSLFALHRFREMPPPT